MIDDQTTVIRLVLAVLLGGLIGFERQQRKKSAGLRTHILVCLGSCLVAILSVTVWEKKSAADSERVNYGEVWNRFPKFVIGFFVASIFTTLIIASMNPKLGAAYSKDILGPVKTLRAWTFTWTFLSIGFTTRFRELTSFGWKPLAAFAIGVAINVPLGYWLSNVVFVEYWLSIK